MFNHHCMAGYPVGFYYQNRFPMPAYIVYCIVHINYMSLAFIASFLVLPFAYYVITSFSRHIYNSII